MATRMRVGRAECAIFILSIDRVICTGNFRLRRETHIAGIIISLAIQWNKNSGIVSQ